MKDPHLSDKDQVIKNSVFYDKPPLIKKTDSKQTEILVANADCMEIGRLLKVSGLNPVVLNMANRNNPGGGVLSGSGAQEENIFRRSNIFYSLYQFISYSEEYGIKKNPDHQYPMNRDTGGIYSPDITIFRGSDNCGYILLDKPYQLSFISVAAINRPDLEMIDNKYRIVKNLIKPAKEKLRTILRIAHNHNHNSIVLSAFGCGAFKNPPEHVAELFKEVFEEDEFKNVFETIVFAIFDDHNAKKEHNPLGNYLPFVKVFQ